MRPVNDLDRRLASRKLAELVTSLEEGGEEALQQELDKMFPGTKANPRPPHITWRRSAAGASRAQ